MVMPNENPKMENGPLKTLTLVFVLTVSFLLWGFLLFYTIGDKGPPSWDFNIVRDIPGESVHSTHPSLSGKISEPDPQHVSKAPRSVDGEEKRTGGK
jgi:hypothetical protein